jgi:hypothetical protein
MAGVPQTRRQTLAWSYSNTATFGAATFTNLIQVVLNSPYDPDLAVGGNSAQGFAKMMAFYSKCYCTASRIKLSGVNLSGTGVAAGDSVLAAGLTITTTSNSLATVEFAINVGLSEYKLIGSSPDHYMFSQGLDVGKFLNKPRVLDDPTLFCTSSANPGEIIVGHCWVKNLASAGTFYTSFIVEVEFDCIFTDPLPFA